MPILPYPIYLLHYLIAESHSQTHVNSFFCWFVESTPSAHLMLDIVFFFEAITQFIRLLIHQLIW